MTDLFELTQSAIAGIDADIELVDVERAALGLLVVTIDKPEGIKIEDCEQVSRLLSRVYEVEEIDYKRLEVGSPGVDRPLKTLQDLNRFVGQQIQIKLYNAIDNQKVFSGVYEADAIVEDPNEAAFRLTYTVNNKNKTSQTIQFAFSDLEKAKLDPVLDFKGKNK
ncbi:ribosome maturation factor RimP [Brackiella oedipodis]|uniref:ribosome maturation factor RimP n=1 Tax=Brackiella oedipodis TaxID=124225 RepID=UPI0004902767|nr:ribosome maturation factor RimP [Brackiella oedipodis]